MAVQRRQQIEIGHGGIVVGAAIGKHVVGDHHQMVTLTHEGFQTPLDGGEGIVHLLGAKQHVGCQIAHALQQHRAPLGQDEGLEIAVVLHGFKAQVRPLAAVFFNAGAAFGVPRLHGGDIVSRPGQPGDDGFGKGAFAAGAAADDKMRHTVTTEADRLRCWWPQRWSSH